MKIWFRLAVAGVVLVSLAMIVVTLVIVDKPRFGWMVGRSFLGVITSGMILGSLLMLIAGWKLPVRPWQRIVLIAWALIGVTSPGFGFLFLVPWGVLLLLLPLVIYVLWTAGSSSSSVVPNNGLPPSAV